MDVPALGPSEIGVLGASVMFMFKILGDLIAKLIPKSKTITDEDLKEMEFKTNLKGILDEMRKTSDKTIDRVYHNGKAIDDIRSISDRTHKYAGEAKEHIKTMSQLIANGNMCSYSKGT